VSYVGAMRMKCKTETFPILLIALFLVISISIVGFSVSGNEISEDNGFELVNWSIDKDLVQPEEEVTITGEIRNLGEDGDDEEVILKINEEEENRKDLFIGPGESKEISFSHSEKEEGTYTVSVELDSSDDELDLGEFQVELVTRVEINPDVDQTITAGEEIDFSASAYSGENDDDPSTEDSIFNWENTDEVGVFDNTEAGEYEVSATYNDVSSETVIVTVEPADPEVLVFLQTPSEDTITAGETAEYTVQVQDGFGNIQPEGTFHVALEVEGDRRHSTYIDEGESNATLDWSTTTGRQGDYKVEVIEIDNNEALEPAEKILTVMEGDNESVLAGQWWIFPLIIVIIATISIIYLSDTNKRVSNLNILGSLGKKRKPRTHEWQRNKEPEETDGEIETSDKEVIN